MLYVVDGHGQESQKTRPDQTETVDVQVVGVLHQGLQVHRVHFYNVNCS